MEKPGKKLKKFFIIIGTTGMVYAGLKYLLPLVVPLLLGYTLALLLRPSARFLQHRIIICVFGKKWKPSLGLLGTVQLLILGVLGSFLLTMGARRLWEETSTLMDQLPVWLDGLYFWIEGKYGLKVRGSYFCLFHFYVRQVCFWWEIHVPYLWEWGSGSWMLFRCWERERC